MGMPGKTLKRTVNTAMIPVSQEIIKQRFTCPCHTHPTEYARRACPLTCVVPPWQVCRDQTGIPHAAHDFRVSVHAVFP